MCAYDVKPSALEALPSSVQRLTSSREVGECTDIVITALPKPANVKTALTGEKGLLESLGHGKVVT